MEKLRQLALYSRLLQTLMEAGKDGMEDDVDQLQVLYIQICAQSNRWLYFIPLSAVNIFPKFSLLPK